jgi:hypothetical protein
VVSRLPRALQTRAVGTYARLVRAFHQLRDPAHSIPLDDYLVSAYDDLTPRWRHYHTPIEASRWFYESGFAPAVLTHWDNPYGFGLVAVKTRPEATPGIHYGRSPKLWDNSTTVLGRLHRD